MFCSEAASLYFSCALPSALSLSLSVCLCVSVSASLSLSVSLCLCLSLSLSLCVSLCVCLSVCVSLCVSLCLSSVSPSLSLCVSLCVYFPLLSCSPRRLCPSVHAAILCTRSNHRGLSCLCWPVSTNPFADFNPCNYLSVGTTHTLGWADRLLFH